MHGLTPVSILGAITSLLVTPGLLFLQVRARRDGRFHQAPFLGFLLFESMFLVGYMAVLSFSPSREAATPEPLDAALGAVHGILALAVFLGYWVLFLVARNAYARNRNLFGERPWVHWTSGLLRVATLLSGEAIFILHWVR